MEPVQIYCITKSNTYVLTHDLQDSAIICCALMFLSEQFEWPVLPLLLHG